MNSNARPITILLADDDEDDCMLTKTALEECRLANRVDITEDGEQLMDYLNRRGKYAVHTEDPLPGLILLDLNMPRKSGREALQEIRADPKLRHIPIVVLTTSKAEEDILRTYKLGVNSFIVKPVTFESLVEIVKTLVKYWFEIVELPSPCGAH
jgi:CheY-like chemotaxis protein